MKIKNIFKKPIDREIKGVVTIGNEQKEQRIQELEEYVVTKELLGHFRMFFKAYCSSIHTPTDRIGVWITGFFGSGKSHFLKILSYLLENIKVDNKSALEFFDDKIEDNMIKADIETAAKVDNTVVLFNIDSKAKAGAKNIKTAIMEVMLRTFNEKLGYCATIPWVANFERILIEENNYDKFKVEFENNSSKSWIKGRNKALFERDNIIKALVKVRDMSEESARKFFDDQQNNYYIDTETFAETINQHIKATGHRVIFLMDEIGQYIGEHTDLMLNLQTVVEDLGKICKGKAWVVVTSQQGIDEIIEDSKYRRMDFSKIQGRFATRLLMSGSNADEVIKKRILDKSDDVESPLMSIYEDDKSRISNLITFQLKPSWNGYNNAEEFKDVYPFVPYQFELLQKVFEAIREHGLSEGKHLSQGERSLLSAFQESAKNVKDNEVELLIPFNSFYNTIEQFIDYNIKLVFSGAENRTQLNEFAIEVLKVLFMIKHIKEMPATLERLATLMVSNINEDKLELKKKISEALKHLEAETLVQKNGEEYDFLTNEEQDINRQINNAQYNEAEVIRRVSDVVYEKILENNKYRYKKRYVFGLNRYVDYDIRGSQNKDNIDIKVVTDYSGISDEAELRSESTRTSAIVIDLRKGSYLDELIKAAKIDTFKRNNAVGRGSSFTEIMSKKEREAHERIQRAENRISKALRTDRIYFNGSSLDIKSKDPKDRLHEALDVAVLDIYYKLDYIKVFTNDNSELHAILNGRDSEGMLDSVEDSNQSAFNEILDFINDAKTSNRKETVKRIIHHFKKQPYGWKEIDIRAIIAKLWFDNKLNILIHNMQVQKDDSTFINNFINRNNEDNMVVVPHEKIPDEKLNEVRKIMKKAFNQNFDLNEESLKDGSLHFFKNKKDFLHDINVRYDNYYPGQEALKQIHSRFDTITSITNNLAFFNKVIELKEELIKDGEILEKLTAFYNEGSPQKRNYEESLELVSWYKDNKTIEDLSELNEIVKSIDDILSDHNLFTRIPELSKLTMKGNQIKQRILKNKFENAKNTISNNLERIKIIMNDYLDGSESEKNKHEVNQLYKKYDKQFSEMLSNLQLDSPNIEGHIYASEKKVKQFKTEILQIVNADTSHPESSQKIKHISLSKGLHFNIHRIKNEDDIDKLTGEIREYLKSVLANNDYIEID